MSTTVDDVIKSAAGVARDAAEGRLDPAELDQAVAEECKALFGTVVGLEDPLFAVQLDVARQVLAVGGISASEVAEWAAVLRRRAGGAVETSELSEGAGVPGTPDSTVSGPHSPGTAGPADEPETDPDE